MQVGDMVAVCRDWREEDGMQWTKVGSRRRRRRRRRKRKRNRTSAITAVLIVAIDTALLWIVLAAVSPEGAALRSYRWLLITGVVRRIRLRRRPRGYGAVGGAHRVASRI